MGKPPAFQFYASDFLSDENVMLMNNQAVGCYIKLLCFNWKQGSIPDDIEKIARLCNEDGSAMAQLWPSLEPCFVPGENGRLINPRIEKERLKQQRFREERSASGKKGAHNRWKDKDKNGSAIDLPMAKNGSSSSSSSSLDSKESEGYTLPSQEEISESSIPKLKTDIGKICEELYQQKIFPKVHAFANGMLKQKRNPKAIIHALSRCLIKKPNPEEAWGYCLQIMKVEDGNYNEGDYRKNPQSRT